MRSGEAGICRLVVRPRALLLVGWMLGCGVVLGEARGAVQAGVDRSVPDPEERSGPRFVVLSGADVGLDLRHRSGARGADKRFMIECVGPGLGLVDVDGDGDLDVYLVQGGDVDADGVPRGAADALRLNDGRGRFAPAGGATGQGFGFGVTAGDLDADGDEDLLVTNLGSNELLRNDDGRLVAVPDAAGLAGAPDDWSMGATMGDVDLDGDLDVYVTNYLRHDRSHPMLSGRPCTWLGCPVPCGPLGLEAQPDRFHVNDGSGHFREASVETGLADVDPGYAFQPIFEDLDGDGDLDLFVANDSVPNSFFVNQGNDPATGLPRFVEHGLRAGLALSATGKQQAGMGVAVADLDGDLAPDLVMTNFSKEHNALFLNASLPETGALFFDEASRAGLGRPSYLDLGWGASTLDVDHDGDLDVFIANGHVYPQVDDCSLSGMVHEQPDRLYEQVAPGRFRTIGTVTGERVASSRGSAAGDLDGDGDLDVLVAVIDDLPLLWRNQHDVADDWLLLDLRPLHVAVGARVVLELGEHRALGLVRRGSSFLSTEDCRLHFGLPARATGRPVARVRWPDGLEERFEDLARGRVLTLTRGAGR